MEKFETQRRLQVLEVVREAEQRLGPVDIAICCAGAAYPGKMLPILIGLVEIGHLCFRGRGRHPVQRHCLLSRTSNLISESKAAIEAFGTCYRQIR